VALAATGFHDVAPVRGKDSFTTFLTKALKIERENERDVSAPYLKTLISVMLNNPDMLDSRGTSRRVTPDYFPFSNNTITLRVLPVRGDHRGPVVKPGPETPPQSSSQTPLPDRTRHPSSRGMAPDLCPIRSSPRTPMYAINPPYKEPLR
jgi:hypothetical protein